MNGSAARHQMIVYGHARLLAEIELRGFAEFGVQARFRAGLHEFAGVYWLARAERALRAAALAGRDALQVRDGPCVLSGLREGILRRCGGQDGATQSGDQAAAVEYVVHFDGLHRTRT